MIGAWTPGRLIRSQPAPDVTAADAVVDAEGQELPDPGAPHPVYLIPVKKKQFPLVGINLERPAVNERMNHHAMASPESGDLIHCH